MAAIKEGDTVTLKSGGPIMTVREIVDPDESGTKWAVCVWIDESGKPQEKYYPLTVLEPDDGIPPVVN